MIAIFILISIFWFMNIKSYVNPKVMNTKQWESKAYDSKCSSSPSKRTYLKGSMKILRKSKNYQLCFALSTSVLSYEKNSNFVKPLKFYIHRRTTENLKREGWNKFSNLLPSERSVWEYSNRLKKKVYVERAVASNPFFSPLPYLTHNPFFFSFSLRRFVNHKWGKTFRG